jgi:hypothetical protein
MVYREIETDGEMAMFVKCFWMSDSQNDEAYTLCFLMDISILFSIG